MSYLAQSHKAVFCRLWQVFIHALVRNLFGEGNDVFCEGEWARSVELHTEALNITEYAESEDIVISPGAREKMFANRAAAYLNIVSMIGTCYLTCGLPMS